MALRRDEIRRRSGWARTSRRDEALIHHQRLPNPRNDRRRSWWRRRGRWGGLIGRQEPCWIRKLWTGKLRPGGEDVGWDRRQLIDQRRQEIAAAGLRIAASAGCRQHGRVGGDRKCTGEFTDRKIASRCYFDTKVSESVVPGVEE